MRILMVGLDAAGKTTILYKLKLGEGERQNNDFFMFIWILRASIVIVKHSTLFLYLLASSLALCFFLE
jgi:GTPase SAR1 family protein